VYPFNAYRKKKQALLGVPAFFIKPFVQIVFYFNLKIGGTLQVAWTVSALGSATANLHGQFPRWERAAASCMDNFRVGNLLMQVAWTVSALGICSCKSHGQFPRGEFAHASCMDSFRAGNLLMQVV
jgi:hypothetical protein